ISNLIGRWRIGAIAIDRALTAAEKQQVARYYIAQGSPGVWEAGAELVTNGGFDTDMSGWTTSNATAASVSGEGQVTATSNFGSIYQNFTVTVGSQFLSSTDMRRVSGTGIVEVRPTYG